MGSAHFIETSPHFWQASINLYSSSFEVFVLHFQLIWVTHINIENEPWLLKSMGSAHFIQTPPHFLLASINLYSTSLHFKFIWVPAYKINSKEFSKGWNIECWLLKFPNILEHFWERICLLTVILNIILVARARSLLLNCPPQTLCRLFHWTYVGYF